ncbi:hypothetical protein [Fulvivirga lutea]|uniref:Uncharacterized protein n=1 Tax=Fulvivirga lutea TaxID=2810512 RepID=A0A975A0P7_9BACT|nr:hypothetical protein [Fulvivirga lutea]QSE97031.1 hypothetical protein JR347_15750 [Fulvivirga lutea]
MKFKLLFILLAVFAMSCSEDDVKEALDQNETITVDESILVDLDENSPTEFSAVRDFDASLAGFTLKDVTIQSFIFEITSYTGDAAVGDITIENASLTFVGTNPEVSVNISSFNVADAFAQPQELKDALDATAISAIKAKILADEEITIDMSASVDKVPANFEVTLTFVLNVTAGI